VRAAAKFATAAAADRSAHTPAAAAAAAAADFVGPYPRPVFT